MFSLIKVRKEVVCIYNRFLVNSSKRWQNIETKCAGTKFVYTTPLRLNGFILSTSIRISIVIGLPRMSLIYVVFITIKLLQPTESVLIWCGFLGFLSIGLNDRRFVLCALE